MKGVSHSWRLAAHKALARCCLCSQAQTTRVRTDKTSAPRHALNTKGIDLFIADAPSARRQRPEASRCASEMTARIRAALHAVNKPFPGQPVHKAGFGSAAGALLAAAANIKKIEPVLIANGDFRPDSAANWAGYKHPVMLLRASSALRDTSPNLEVELIARKSQFALVQVGYILTLYKPGCGLDRKNSFVNLEVGVATTVAQSLDGAAAPACFGQRGAHRDE